MPSQAFYAKHEPAPQGCKKGSVVSGKFKIAFFLLILIGISYVTLGMPEQRHGNGSDSYWYVRYAELINNKGMVGFKSLTHWYADSAENRYHPAPFRVGYIMLAALAIKIFGSSYSVLVGISLISFFLFLAVSYYYCRKHFDADVAFAFFVLLASSPLLLNMSRVAMIESVVNLLWGTAAWMFLDLMKTPGRRTYWLLITVLSLALLFKESSVILMPFFALAWFFLFRKTCLLSRSEITGLIAWPLLIAGSVLILALGGVYEVLDAMKAVYATHFLDKVNMYALAYSSGPWFRYIVDFILLSPVTTIAFLAYAGFIVLEGKWRREETYFLCYYIFIYAVLSIPQNSKVVRFVINLEMAMCLFTVLFIFQFIRKQALKPAVSLVFLFVIVLTNFQSLMGIIGNLDPITFTLAIQRHLIPPPM
jgi:4-amino-4-deoxy-L-arabinose transferase-like glycosyltransferase